MGLGLGLGLGLRLGLGLGLGFAIVTELAKLLDPRPDCSARTAPRTC